ncbi:hypothetical protein [Salinivibrio kushneri]|uniref:hypothetical protein n=1 Tax=Salinivibrio kushneri TaxID=1908198 RepID=UPI0022B376E6|nr:hypothetical protein [Salinivibrio kushneri]WBA17872.1 hypothetical protein O4598_12420 [Salinivibrio kushneri]
MALIEQFEQLTRKDIERALKDTHAPYAALKRLTAEQASLLASGLAHAGYKSMAQADEASEKYTLLKCGTSEPSDIDFNSLKLVEPKLFALIEGNTSASRIYKFINESMSQNGVNKFDRAELEDQLFDEDMSRMFTEKPCLFPENSRGHIDALRGEHAKFPEMLPPPSDQTMTAMQQKKEKEADKRPGRSEANASKREKVLAAAMHVMVENLAQDGSMWRNNRPVGARVADYLYDHAFSLFGTYDAPLGKETMARLINFAITKPEPTDEQ